MAVTCPFSVDKSRRPFGTAANMQQSKAREFARSRSHRPASFCWCVREAAPYTPRNSTLLSCTHMPGNCPKNVKQGLPPTDMLPIE